MDFNEMEGWGTDWIYVAEDKNRFRAVVNIVMKIRFI
jgi:hypothetical protein